MATAQPAIPSTASAGLLQFFASLSGHHPQRKNGPVIQTCTQCGAINEEQAHTCCFCDARLAPAQDLPAAIVPSAPTEGNLARELDWRHEVAHRLQAYRARRRRLHPNAFQAPLPFSDTLDTPEFDAAEEPSAECDTPDRVERMEIAVAPPRPNPLSAEDRLSGSRPRRGVAGAAPLLPVAELAERLRAGLLDAAFLLLAYVGFLALFGALGGHLAFGKFDAVVYAAALALFYAQYFALFTVFGGSTPGMLLRRLHVVSFDGSAPTPRQLLWRSFGYLVSGGTVLLGFLWALWDEDHLTWQDRISQTYLTRTAHARESEPREAPG